MKSGTLRVESNVIGKDGRQHEFSVEAANELLVVC